MNGNRRPMIIAMQGDPCTGKTTIARELAKTLKCSTFCLDDILDAMCPPTKPENVDAFMSQTFDLLTEIVRTQTILGMSIIVDSPLSRSSHLKKLVDLSIKQYISTKSGNKVAPSLIIIECRPKTKYTWLMRFEKHSHSYEKKWYKPHSWPFGHEFSRDYTDDHDAHPSVPKLVINTTDPYSTFEVVDVLQDLIESGEGRKTEYDKWWPIVRTKLEERTITEAEDQLHAKNKILGRRKGISKGHNVRIYTEKGVDQEGVNCGVCLNPLTQSGEDGAYTCSGCPLAIHKSCAELDGSTKVFTPQNFPKFLLQSSSKKSEYCFPEEHLCIECKKQGKEFSYECGYCVYECHMKCQLVPTIVQHQAHKHALFFKLNSISRGGSYECMACRNYGKFVRYACVDRCMGCNFHPECILLPPLVREHMHGGYTHDLEMILHREEELEDYICPVCFEQMNSDAWFYCCKICHLELHLDCAFKEF